MKNALLLCLAMISSGCVLSRSVVMSDAIPTLEAPEVKARWDVKEVFARASAGGMSDGQLRDFAPLKEQLETRLRRTLQAQSNLGRRAENPEFEISLDINVGEHTGLSPWLGLGLGLETGVLLAGAGAGFAIGGPPGGLIGLLVATPIAIVSAATPPNTTEVGEFEGTISLRRPGGPVIATRHVRSSWKTEMNGYHRETKLAKESGEGAKGFEREILEALRQMLLEIPQAPANGQAS
jgi:hypothetical protein